MLAAGMQQAIAGAGRCMGRCCSLVGVEVDLKDVVRVGTGVAARAEAHLCGRSVGGMRRMLGCGGTRGNARKQMIVPAVRVACAAQQKAPRGRREGWRVPHLLHVGARHGAVVIGAHIPEKRK